MIPNHLSLYNALLPAVREAGDTIMQIYHQGASVSVKTDGSPVTEADRQAEAILLRALKEVAPDTTIISEENAESHKLTAPEQFFLVDPLDGTKEFLKADGQGAFTVNIALIENGTPIWGIVFAPALDRMFIGSRADGAYEIRNDEEIAIAVRDVPESGPVAVASVSHRDEETDKWLAEYNIEQTVSIGSSLKFCLVAGGEADVYPRFGPTMEWDTAAGDAILRAAGGVVTAPTGLPFVYGKPEYRNGAFIARSAF